MNDQPKEQGQKRRAVRIREATKTPLQTEAVPAEPVATEIDSAATAALALAVSSAKKASPVPESLSEAQGTAAEVAAPVQNKPADGNQPARRYAAYAAALLLAVTGGWMGGQAVSSPAPTADQPWSEAVAALRQGHEDVIRLTGDVKALKVAIEAMKDGVDRSRADLGAKQAQLIERLDRSDRGPQDASAKVDQLKAQLDRIEAVAKDPALKLAGLGERLDRIERQVAANAAAKPLLTAAAAPIPSAPPPPVAAPAPAPTASAAPQPLPEPAAQTGSIEPKAKDATVDGWVLHEVYDGVALIESRSRRLIEVGPGEMVPGVGRVETIERRGKRWVVVTAKGIISSVH